jgi:hypothetical protein
MTRAHDEAEGMRRAAYYVRYAAEQLAKGQRRRTGQKDHRAGA